jgi:hypothetical protein
MSACYRMFHTTEYGETMQRRHGGFIWRAYLPVQVQ